MWNGSSLIAALRGDLLWNIKQDNLVISRHLLLNFQKAIFNFPSLNAVSNLLQPLFAPWSMRRARFANETNGPFC
jgi:hypothetical protein